MSYDDEYIDRDSTPSNEVAKPEIVEVPAEASVPSDVPAEWVAAMRLAGRIHSTPFVPKALRGDPHAVLACILSGQELGLGPMQSLRMVHVIDGRPAASAELMRALVNRAGHQLSVVEATNDRVTLTGRRRDTGATATVTWSMVDAQRAKLLGNPSWGKYPRSMLLARATSELCRQIFSDVIGGLYTPEETAAIDARVYEPDLDELVDPLTARTVVADEGVHTWAESRYIDGVDIRPDPRGGAKRHPDDDPDPADLDDAEWIDQAKAPTTEETEP